MRRNGRPAIRTWDRILFEGLNVGLSRGSNGCAYRRYRRAGKPAAPAVDGCLLFSHKQPVQKLVKLIRSRRLLLAIATAASLLIVLCWSFPNEPSYQGKTLSVWLWRLDAPPGRAPLDEAALAMKHFGTNAFPLILDWLVRNDGPFHERVVDWIGKQRYIPIRIRQAKEYRMQAILAFRALRTQADPLVPTLAAMVN